MDLLGDGGGRPLPGRNLPPSPDHDIAVYIAVGLDKEDRLPHDEGGLWELLERHETLVDRRAIARHDLVDARGEDCGDCLGAAKTPGRPLNDEPAVVSRRGKADAGERADHAIFGAAKPLEADPRRPRKRPRPVLCHDTLLRQEPETAEVAS